MSEPKAVTRKLALDCRRASRAGKGQILDQVCGLTGWHRNHARKSIQAGVGPQTSQAPVAETAALWRAVIEGLRFLWAVQALRVAGCWRRHYRTWYRAYAGWESSLLMTGRRHCCCRSRRRRSTGG